jgi:hypothetical protein
VGVNQVLLWIGWAVRRAEFLSVALSCYPFVAHVPDGAACGGISSHTTCGSHGREGMWWSWGHCGFCHRAALASVAVAAWLAGYRVAIFGPRWELCAVALCSRMGNSRVRICGAVEFQSPPSPRP